MKQPNRDRWQIGVDQEIFWDLRRNTRLPHSDHMEMSGEKVSLIVHYSVDEEKRLSIAREVIFPMLRLRKDDVRGYLGRIFGADAEPSLYINGAYWKPDKVSEIALSGFWECTYFNSPDGIGFNREMMPDLECEGIRELWTFWNNSNEDRTIRLHFPKLHDCEEGIYGKYEIKLSHDGDIFRTIKPKHMTLVYWDIQAFIAGSENDRIMIGIPLFRRAEWYGSMGKFVENPWNHP